MRSSKRIMRIRPSIGIDKYCSCNICLKRIGDNDKEEMAKHWTMHELQFGNDNVAQSIRICSECLNDFSDLLWDYLMTEEEQEIDENKT